MSSTAIVRDCRALIQTNVVPAVPQKWQPQLHFGWRAYALQTFQSATSNARRVVANPNTAARKSERLLANTKLAAHLGKVSDRLNLVHSGIYVNVDHSNMHGLTALVWSRQRMRQGSLESAVTRVRPGATNCDEQWIWLGKHSLSRVTPLTLSKTLLTV